MQQPDNKSATRPQQIAILVTLAIGTVVTILWITNVGLQAVESEIVPLLAKAALPTLSLHRTRHSLAFLALALPLASVWRIKIPIRESLIIFLSGLVMIVTPLYIGEITKAFLLKDRFGARLRETSNPRRLGTAVGCNRRFIFVRPHIVGHAPTTRLHRRDHHQSRQRHLNHPPLCHIARTHPSFPPQPASYLFSHLTRLVDIRQRNTLRRRRIEISTSYNPFNSIHLRHC